MFYIIFFSGFLSFVLKRKHLLSMFLSLEMVVISLFYGLLFYFSMFSNDLFFLMIFLTVSVCEGALGLSLLVRLIMVYGNDYFNTFSVLW
uniref:NADH-ubiquinone oxidoreductase chain 4L n=1 Tax=Bostrichoidea sp. 1 KM-2017 TaxID=2219275 RepID=A0A346RJM8_9COLE|nr:NADH dehydrogenase subunit 4L [Bostrichoidea sp. 1 KM-2017]